jgi:dUTP pyrophosphatase
MENVLIRIKKSKDFEDLPLPVYSTEGACAVDLFAAIDDVMIIHPGDRTIISAGISIAVPEGYEASIRPRSGLAWKKGLTVLNSPGTIDSDYRGQVGVILINHGQLKIKIIRGERIAQMLVSPVTRIHWEEGELDETERGANGFGSTDKEVEFKKEIVDKVVALLPDEEDGQCESSTLQDAYDKENGVGEEAAPFDDDGAIKEGTIPAATERLTHEVPRGDEHLNRPQEASVQETTQTSTGEAPADTTKAGTDVKTEEANDADETAGGGSEVGRAMEDLENTDFE